VSRTKANCPSCGAEVAFKIGTSLVTVCEFCHTVVARGDRTVQDLGKVVDLVETASPLQLDLKGKYNGKAFRIVGRCQFSHSAGGVWDEWYCAFPGGKWGWLAEAQGQFHLTFEQELPAGLKLPGIDSLQVGRRIKLPDVGTFTVAEIGTATTLGAAGELPFEPHPNEVSTFVDLAGPASEFATFDYGLTPAVAYVGRTVTLDDIGIDQRAIAPAKVAREVAALSLSCPQCGGALELRAPDQTQRVACPYCNSLLDATKGTLQYLQSLDPLPRPILIPLGSKGTFQGIEYTVLGFVSRSVTFDGVDYYWDEYLLYQPREGFRWLVESDNNWSFVQPVSIGEVNTAHQSAFVTWQGETFKIFQKAVATVRFVAGEFYWKIAPGERVWASDFIHPPQMISLEEPPPRLQSDRAAESIFLPDDDQPRPDSTFVPSVSTQMVAGEITASLGTYLPHAEVETAFGISGLPRSGKIAPNQPFPYKTVYRDAGLLLAGLFLLGMCFVVTASPHEVFRHSYTILQAGAVAAPVIAPMAPVGPNGLPVPQPPDAQLPGAQLPGAPVVPNPAPVPPVAAAVPAPGQPAPAAGDNKPAAPAAAPAPVVVEPNTFFSDTPIELRPRQPIEIFLSSGVNQSWVSVEGQLFNEETGDVQPFEVSNEFYSGIEGGESWSEGSRRTSTIVSALPAGKYTLRIEGQSGSSHPESITIAIEQGSFRILNFFLAFLALALFPLCVLLYHWNFDRRRWEDSEYSTYSSGSSDDD